MDLTDLVRDDRESRIFRVHRSTMTSPEILALERERIFSRCWLYIGHASELENPGDYRRRSVGGRPLVFVRGKDGTIRALHNTCPHRGAIVCRQDAGTANTFQCFYHAWTFDNQGALVGMPDADGYENPGFVKKELGLAPVARHESYRDFHFVCFDPSAPALEDYLADAKEILDLIADQSLDGRMKVVSGTQRYSIRANWKLLAENSFDGYHAAPLHRSYLAYLQGTGALRRGEMAIVGGCRPLGNGHGVIEYKAPWGRPVARWAPTFGAEAEREIEDIRAELFRRHGQERGERIADWNRNMGIFPNLAVNDIMAITIRTYYPIAPDQMEVTAWELAPAEESGERLARRLHNFLEFLGPGGFATPDDVEALDSCQIGFAADGVVWSDISRGMAREPRTDDELQMRSFWREWHARMNERRIDDWGDGPLGNGHAR
jgi:p-cumate 2,3-dioxygenase subunit alpha